MNASIHSNAADWDADRVRDDLRSYVVEHLGHESGVLIVDETGFLKKGDKSVGVKRQYSGTAGRIENCQIGTFLCYASDKGAAFLDRALYLPKEWAENKSRRSEAGVPETAEFATKPALAQQMLLRALDAKVPCAWVLGDEVYGGDRRLRFTLEQRQQAFVLAVAKNEPLMFGGPGVHTAEAIVAKAALPDRWEQHSAGKGSKGLRLYDWSLTELWRLQLTPEERAWGHYLLVRRNIELWRLQLTPEERAWGHYLLVRRNIEKPTDIAYYVVFCRREVASLETLAAAAGSRWQIESSFEAAKGECGLDQYEVRKWPAWYRHITLSLLAHAFLVVMRARAGDGKHGQKGAMEQSPRPPAFV